MWYLYMGSMSLTAFRYTSPNMEQVVIEDTHLSATNYEDTTLFLVSCFQYIIVAAVFSIGPPYRRPMWTNGKWSNLMQT